MEQGIASASRHGLGDVASGARGEGAGKPATSVPLGVQPQHGPSPKMRARHLTVRYGGTAAVTDVNLDVPAKQVLALIGPSGCGKSTFVRSLNRMNDTVPGASVSGDVQLDGESICGAEIDPVLVRKRVGMVFQRASPFPTSIFENVAYTVRVVAMRERRDVADRVEHALRQAELWNEVKDRLSESGLSLSGGQQQRLCIARALAVEPEVLLMDEPTSALDPTATAKIEELVSELRKGLTIVIVTHSMQQAARISQRTGFFNMGSLIEVGDTTTMFTRPREHQTEDYISGRFGRRDESLTASAYEPRLRVRASRASRADPGHGRSLRTRAAAFGDRLLGWGSDRPGGRGSARSPDRQGRNGHRCAGAPCPRPSTPRCVRPPSPDRRDAPRYELSAHRRRKRQHRRAR